MTDQEVSKKRMKMVRNAYMKDIKKNQTPKEIKLVKNSNSITH